jgi:hypothetical protein
MLFRAGSRVLTTYPETALWEVNAQIPGASATRKPSLIGAHIVAFPSKLPKCNTTSQANCKKLPASGLPATR